MIAFYYFGLPAPQKNFLGSWLRTLKRSGLRAPEAKIPSSRAPWNPLPAPRTPPLFEIEFSVTLFLLLGRIVRECD